MESKKLNTFKT